MWHDKLIRVDPALDDERIDNLRRVRTSLLLTARHLTGPRPDMRWARGGLLGTMNALAGAKGSVERAGRDDDAGSLDSIRAEVEALLPYTDPAGRDYEERSKSIAASCFELSGRISDLGGYYPV